MLGLLLLTFCASIYQTEETNAKIRAEDILKVDAAIVSNELVIQNTGDAVWPKATVYIDGILNGYSAEVIGPVRPGEIRSLALNGFTTRGGKRFQPQLKEPRELIVSVPGYDSPVLTFK